MFDRLVIIGAGGHGKVVADIAAKNGIKNICFLDDLVVGKCLGFPIIGVCDDASKYQDEDTAFVIAIGDNHTRKAFAEKHSLRYVSLVHPSAQIGLNVKIGVGTVVMACAVVNSCSDIGEHCIINSGAVIEHEDVIENYVHVSPKASLGGNVHIGESTHIGIGTTVINNIDICGGCIIGAGAVVVRNIKESSVYIGIPAKKSAGG